ncbi:MAG TPA: sugar phosphate isomerase/epimerase [Bryobacteraceae bacterium]|jgi:sugar phosphate isomerase/epimerase|nr:sugar phosphate isomerase/epimerase [Bryobacteraceae bacterium]
MTSRREFVQATTLAATLCAAVRARQLRTVGVQLYTVRTVLPQKPAEVLGAIDQIGYQEVEATYASLEAIWPALTATRLKPVSIHLDSTLITKGKDEDIARTFGELRHRGFTYAVFPYLPPAERGGLDVIRALSDKLNHAGEKAKAAGLTFCYHNHAFEFEPMEGTTGFQVMMDHTDKKLVGLEMDVFWVSVAGHDPAELLGKLSGRVPLLHLKDKERDTPVMYKESVPKTAFREVGHGVIDWPKVLNAAESAGVSHYFVEQDQTPGDPVESLRQSFTYLSKLNY